MAWCLIINAETGELVSEASDRSLCAPAEVLAAKGLEVIEHGDDRPDHTTKRWEPGTKRFVPKETKDRVEDLKGEPEFSGLTPAQWQAVERAFDKVLGPRRFRTDDEPVDIRER
jgi:hypothetical protein